MGCWLHCYLVDRNNKKGAADRTAAVGLFFYLKKILHVLTVLDYFCFFDEEGAAERTTVGLPSAVVLLGSSSTVVKN